MVNYLLIAFKADKHVFLEVPLAKKYNKTVLPQLLVQSVPSSSRAPLLLVVTSWLQYADSCHQS